MYLCVWGVITGEQRVSTHGSGPRQSRPGSGAGRRSAASLGCSGGVCGTGTDLGCSGLERAPGAAPGWPPGLVPRCRSLLDKNTEALASLAFSFQLLWYVSAGFYCVYSVCFKM